MAGSLSLLLAGNNVPAEEALIIPGTTPTLFVSIDKDIMKESTNARIDILEEGMEIPLQVFGAINETGVSYTFTQGETYQFTQGSIKIQVHGITTDGTAWKTKVFTIDIGESLSNTII